MSNQIKKLIQRIKSSFKTRFLVFKDAAEVLLGYRHELAPPKRYDYINSGGNDGVGEEYFKYFVEKGHLKPTDCVLEVGSGFGRMAIPLTTYLKEEGHYEGVDIIKDGVNWCQSKFTPKFPNFQFQRIDVYNDRYHPKGFQKASEFVFPFETNTFDFVYLTSIFTHMFPKDMENYLSEISRVLKPNGRCLITYFLLKQSTPVLVNADQSIFSFKHAYAHHYVEDINHPEYAVAYEEAFVRDLYKKVNLKIVDPIDYGNWNGRQEHLSFQDIIVGINYNK